MSAPLLSIVTGTRDREESFKRLIKSVITHASVDWEMIAADASEVAYRPVAFEAAQFVDERISCPRLNGHLQVWRESPPLGHVKGYNRLFSACTGKYVMWLNDDAEVFPGYDRAAIDFMEVNPSVGLGAFYYSEPPRQPRFHVNFCYGMLFANFGIIQRDFGNSIGWFDEDFTMYGSDNSITFRTLLAGKGIGTIPGPFIVHHSTQDEVRLANQHHRKPGSELLRSKYYPLVPQMKAVYSRTAHLVGPKIWVG